MDPAGRAGTGGSAPPKAGEVSACPRACLGWARLGAGHNAGGRGGAGLEAALETQKLQAAFPSGVGGTGYLLC